MDKLRELENKSIYIMREVKKQFKKPAILWSVGKDSMTLLHLARKAFFGMIPFPVIHINTGYKFPEMYEFRDKIVKEWGIKLIVAQNKEATATPETNKLECCTQRKN
jgi:sulfate adenylyltransferase subunit 2